MDNFNWALRPTRCRRNLETRAGDWKIRYHFTPRETNIGSDMFFPSRLPNNGGGSKYGLRGRFMRDEPFVSAPSFRQDRDWLLKGAIMTHCSFDEMGTCTYTVDYSAGRNLGNANPTGFAFSPFRGFIMCHNNTLIANTWSICCSSRTYRYFTNKNLLSVLLWEPVCGIRAIISRTKTINCDLSVRRAESARARSTLGW